MKSKSRYLDPFLRKDLEKKMVFLGGPRQVGKTTLAQRLANELDPHPAYLNWDSAEDRRLIRALRFPSDARVLVLDEIHKFSGWRNHIKGLFDKHKDRYQILVTGSSRLDYYRRGGDSLLGRYHHYRLHPFSVAEILTETRAQSAKIHTPFKELEFPPSNPEAIAAVERLKTFGGFPEPYFDQNLTTLRRWHLDRKERLLEHDIRDAEKIQDLNKLEVLMDLLPGKVGSLFSLNSLREDLEVNHRTVARWVDILERFYVHFRLSPYHAKPIQSLRKQPKLYFWDWSETPEGGARQENMVASHLLKLVHFLRDVEGHKAELFYLRDKEQREVDFLVTVDRKPWFAVEVKSNSDRISKDLRYFGQRVGIPFLYQVGDDNQVDSYQDGVRQMGIPHFLSGLV